VRKRSPRRTPPLILGHEFAGRVLAVGDGVEGWKEGDPVVANAVIADGTCPSCRRGLTNACENRQLFGMHRPGAFAEWVTAPAGVLIRRQESSSPAQAALSEPLANGVHITNLLRPYSPQTAVVFGAGPIGLMALQALKIVYGCRIAVIDRDNSRLKTATALGADLVALPDEMQQVTAWAGPGGIDATVDAVGAGATKSASLVLLRPGGTAVWIGLHEDESPMSAYALILPEKRILGSYACTQEELQTALGWIESGNADVSSWVSSFPLSQADVAFHQMLKPGPGDVKAVILNG
jgi:threonine dehydrogenase-like Zn-dependent dehydrogenase